MRIWALIISFFWMLLASITYIYISSFIGYAWWWKILYNDPKVFKEILSKIQWKNYLQRNNKIYIVSNYIITPETKISWVVEINWSKKKFSNLTLSKLKQYNGIWKIYITQIWDINLQGAIILNWYKWWTLLHWGVKEKNKK